MAKRSVQAEPSLAHPTFAELQKISRVHFSTMGVSLPCCNRHPRGPAPPTSKALATASGTGWCFAGCVERTTLLYSDYSVLTVRRLVQPGRVARQLGSCSYVSPATAFVALLLVLLFVG